MQVINAILFFNNAIKFTYTLEQRIYITDYPLFNYLKNYYKIFKIFLKQ